MSGRAQAGRTTSSRPKARRTALTIARELGLPNNQVLTGSEMDALSDQALRAWLRDVQVFARIVPQQKLRLVQAFKANGEIIAMTGDGVNDAPALKAAHIGVAMGKRGTDVAREAGGLVLLDDNFASLVAAIRLGRRIYGNLRKAMSYTMAVHISIIGMAFLPALLGQPLLLLPAHIMFLELIINPTCAIVFEAEPEASNAMRRPPRAPDEELFGGQAMLGSLLRGLAAFTAAMAVYVAATYSGALGAGMNADTVRALVFVAIVAENIALAFSSRTLDASGDPVLGRRNPALWWMVAAALAGLTTILSVPLLRELFHFGASGLYAVAAGLFSASVTGLGCMLARRVSAMSGTMRPK